MSADRVFSILQGVLRSPMSKRPSQVAKALQPLPRVDLSAHRILLDLARGSDGRTRLVTTNFELLFEDSNPHLKNHWQGQLPDPQRYEELC